MSSSPATSRAYVGDATCVVPLAVRRDANALSGGEDARDEHDATTLLVGTGGSLTWYAPFDADATGGRRRACVRVFEDGERVHGGRDFGDGKRVVAWGERRVRVVRASEERSGDGWTLQTESGLPAFGAWVHDVRGVLSASGGDSRDIAVGLSDNSVERWCENVGEHGRRAWTRAARMECESRCLLYTLELSASATWEGMRVAGGTIYNEIQVWGVTDGVVRENCVGHEGSLMRVRFSDDGSSIYSASDDRTARVWNLEDGTGADGSFRAIRPHVVLAGHVARVWDCVRVEGERPVYATGGEDCTVRIWDANAAAGGETLADGVRKREDCELAALRGHRGRGIWRLCALRAPNGSVTLASAGADGSVKLWNMSDWTRTQATSAGSMALHESTTPVPPGRVDKAMTDEVKDVNMTDVDAQEGDAQSGKKRKKKSKRRQSIFSADDEFVRVVRVLRHGSLFVATNHGFLYRVKWMRDRETWDWQLAYDNVSSLMSMCVEEADEEDVVALADLDGKIIIVRLSRATGECTEVTKIDASEPRLLMDVFFCKGKIFASIVGGVIKCWRIANPTECSFTLKNPYGHRILALDVCENSNVVLVGDQKGNLCVFNVAVDAAELPVIAQKWSAHEKNCSVNVCRIHDGPSFITGGRDSNVCTWNTVRSGDKMELVLASKWTAPSKSSVMFAGVGESGELEHAAGFRETDFVAYSVDDQRQTLRVACKKINMPHDALMGYGDKIIFVYRKAKELHISMRWSESHADSSLDKQTNIWSHGREIHTVGIIPAPDDSSLCVVSGAEDGTVMRFLYDPKREDGSRVHSPADICKHPGGRTVKALSVFKESDTSYMLCAGGAKEVLLAFRITWFRNESNAWEVRSKALVIPKPVDKPGTRSWKKGCGFVEPRRESDQRIMDVATYASGKQMRVVYSTSLGEVSVVCVDEKARAWQTLSSLQYHTCPVLSVDVIESTKGVWGVTGGTDGGVALWRMMEDTSSISPALTFEQVHQSGVNALSIAQTKTEGTFIIVSGGDDQTLRAQEIVVDASGAALASRTATFDFSHSSAIRSVWTDGSRIVSTSVDQRVKFWLLDDSFTIHSERGVMTQAPEPEAIVVHRSSAGALTMAVAGRGFEIFDIARA